MHNYLIDNLGAVRAEIAAAAQRSGRKAAAITLIAVTKTQPAELLAAAVAAGVTDIGENYLQEAADKFAALGWPEYPQTGAPVRRHAIGHIQGNKARLAVRLFDIIQSVDSAALAARIDRVAGELGRVVPVLLQVNISAEGTKSGFFPAELAGILPSLANLSNVSIQGLMTIGQFSADLAVARADFVAMRELRDRLLGECPAGISLGELSMGMSHDFAIAIEEGATMVRVGTLLFGPRS